MWWRNAQAGHNAQAKGSVRIIAIPPGEAPLWVREKWVGLILPLTRYGSANTFRTFGVLSGPRTFLPQVWALALGRSNKTYGFPVNAARAVEILGHASPEAAAWWRENARELILPGRYLLFHAEVCDLVTE
jgi:hypothetical protein